MKFLRNMGSYIKEVVESENIDEELICYDLGCTKQQWNRFLYGRMFMSFENLTVLSEMINLPIDEIMKNAEHGKLDRNFSNQENKEKILDLIEQYIDIAEMVD